MNCCCSDGALMAALHNFTFFLVKFFLSGFLLSTSFSKALLTINSTSYPLLSLPDNYFDSRPFSMRKFIIGLWPPAGKPSTSPRFPHGFMGEFQGIIPVEISSSFPCGNSGEIKENILCGYFPLFSLQNHRGYFHMEISLIFPSNDKVS